MPGESCKTPPRTRMATQHDTLEHDPVDAGAYRPAPRRGFISSTARQGTGFDWRTNTSNTRGQASRRNPKIETGTGRTTRQATMRRPLAGWWPTTFPGPVPLVAAPQCGRQGTPKGRDQCGPARVLPAALASSLTRLPWRPRRARCRGWFNRNLTGAGILRPPRWEPVALRNL